MRARRSFARCISGSPPSRPAFSPLRLARARPTTSSTARRSLSTSARRRAAPTTPMRGCSRAISAATLPGHPSFVVVQNMPGASGRRLMGFIYNVAPKDGTTIATRPARARLRSADGRRQPLRRRARSTGSAAPTTRPMSAWSGTPRRSAPSTTSRRRPMVVGTSGPGIDRCDLSQRDERAVRHAVQGRRRLQGGDRKQHRDGARRDRRPLRHHLGHAGQSLNADWLRDKKIRLLVQFALDKHPELPDVPSVFDLATTEEERQILTVWAAPNKMGRPFFAPPGMAPERLDAPAPRLRRHHEGPGAAGRGRPHAACGQSASPASRSRRCSSRSTRRRARSSPRPRWRARATRRKLPSASGDARHALFTRPVLRRSFRHAEGQGRERPARHRAQAVRSPEKSGFRHPDL